MAADQDLRFSPRPNRAAEIHWRPWGEPAFAEARRLGRPVLLSLSAVWCHWCHVMDETSYSDPRVIAAVNEDFVPIRVDNDRHPDVNRRYNMGGWPTTAFLAASGDVLTGGTYMPPDQLLESLTRVKAFFDSNQPAIQALESERAHAADAAVAAHLSIPAGRDAAHEAFGGDPDASGDLATGVALLAVRGFDPVYGGLGADQKFPQPDVFSFLLAYGTLRGATGREHVGETGSALVRPSRVLDVVRKTLMSMASGDLYDHVAGGFFRYATERDWSVPHYEKMLEDNARLATLYLEASLIAARHELGDAGLYRATAAGTIDYLLETLWQDDVSAFGGSQDADEAYYRLDASARADLPAPSVDRTIYVDWNALAARALLRAAPVLDRPELAERALELLAYLLRTAASGEAVVHYLTPAGSLGGGAPLLADQVGVAAALLDAYEQTGDRAWLERARELVTWAVDRLSASDGRLYDRLAAPGESAGLLAQPVPAIEDNALAADVLLRLEAYTGDARLGGQALDILVAWATHLEQYGIVAASYAQALLRHLERPDHIVVVGARDSAQTRRLHAAALTAPRPLRTVQLLDPARPAEAERIREAGLAGAPGLQHRDHSPSAVAAGAAATGADPAAYVCRGKTCSRFEPD